VLDACLAHRVPLVHVSTDEVYGPMAPNVRASEDHPFRPSSPYAATKAAADLLALAHHRTHALDVRVVRMSNCYGPRQHPEKLLPLAATRALQGLPVPVYGDGLQSREWLHVDDACRGILAALDLGQPGRAYNLGPYPSTPEVSNRTVLRHFLGYLLHVGADDELVEHVADRPGHDRRYALDCSRATAELDWRPTVDLGHGLRDLARWSIDHQAEQLARLR
jgi:dTDP-glucose 4,6-dehydratase